MHLAYGSPNYLLSHRVIEGNLNADKYIELLRVTALPIIKLNYGVGIIGDNYK